MRTDISHLNAHPEGYDYWPTQPGDNTLGWVAAAAKAVPAALATAKSVFSIFGKGGETLSEGAQRALTAGGARPGPFSEAEVQAALQRAPAMARQAVLTAVTEKSFLDPSRGAPFEWDPEHAFLARAAVYLAHGGRDGQLGWSEQIVHDAVANLMTQAGIPAPPSGTGYQGVIPAAALPAIPEWVTEAYDEWGQLATPPPMIAPPVPARAAGIAGMDTKTLLMLAGGSLAVLKMLKIF